MVFRNANEELGGLFRLGKKDQNCSDKEKKWQIWLDLRSPYVMFNAMIYSVHQGEVYRFCLVEALLSINLEMWQKIRRIERA